MRKILVASLAILFIDQLSKFLAVRFIDFKTTIEIFPFFNLVHIKNSGVSFGMFSNQSPYGPYLLALLSLGIVCVLSVLAYKATSSIQKFAFGLIIGGALGNVWDRLANKAVTDFLDFYIGNHHWPAFNLADVAIVAGAAIMLAEPFIKRDKGRCENA